MACLCWVAADDLESIEVALLVVVVGGGIVEKAPASGARRITVATTIRQGFRSSGIVIVRGTAARKLDDEQPHVYAFGLQPAT